jgi:wobble nucleotide-excising tRNase
MLAMFFNHVVESYQEYQQTLAALNEHAESDWHKLSQAVRDDVVKEIEEMLAWSILSDAATSALKKPVKTRKPRQKKKQIVDKEAETLAPESI